MKSHTYPNFNPSLVKSFMMVVLIALCGAVHAQTIMFDDFNYSGVSDAQFTSFNKWSVVSGISGPPEGATYSSGNVTFLNDPGNSANRLMQLNTVVNGSARTVTHSRVETAGYEYWHGTYAARVYMSDVPFTYSDGNVETFFTIVSSSLSGDGSRYSELDFEYMPSDKWGVAPDQRIMYMTAWNRYIANPWQAWKAYTTSVRSWAGWHTFVMSATDGVNVKFYIDGVFMGQLSRTDNDGTSVYPRNPMNISFANWIWNNVIGPSTANRTTSMQVDWTLFYKDVEQSPAQVDALVSTYRSQGLLRRNLAGQTYFSTPCTVPAQPGAIAGNTTVAAGSSQTYSISAVANATSYTWTLPSGWSGSSTSTSITTTAGTTGGTISVRANNSCGSSPTRTLNVTVTTCSVPGQPGTISGNTAVNAGSSQTYSIGGVSGATSYTWSLPSGWSGSSTGTSITTTAGTTGGTISVRANNSCGSGTARTLNVSVNGTGGNVAAGKSAVASSTEAAGLEAGKAVDGSGSTRWASAYSDPQWIYVDLGNTYNITRVKITWEAAYGRDYRIETSSNASSWTPVRTVTGNTALVNDWTVSGTGRYVRIYGTARGTAWGYSIFELEVYGTVTGGGFSLRTEAENYLHMAGLITETCSEGGQNVGSFDAYDWASYNITIPTAGQYQVTFRVASIYAGRTLRFEKDNGATLLATVTIPNTGTWQTWQTTAAATVTLPAGTYPVGLTTYTGGLNVNWFEIKSPSGAREAVAAERTIDDDGLDATKASFYPNPIKRQLTIADDVNEVTRVEIFDNAGNLLLKRSLEQGEKQIDVDQLQPGSYFIRFSDQKGQRIERMIKE